MGVITDCFQADYVARRHGAVGLDVGGPASSGDEPPTCAPASAFWCSPTNPGELCHTSC